MSEWIEQETGPVMRYSTVSDTTSWDVSCTSSSTAIVDLRDGYGRRVDTVAQERQHVSDAAWEKIRASVGPGCDRDVLEDCNRRDGTVTLTVAEHDELLEAAKLKVRYVDESELNALRAEVERLNGELRLQDQANDVLTRDNERLRKEREAGRDAVAADLRDRGASGDPAAIALVVADQLDHRLGVSLPDGEPCEPMSARSWRRST